MQRTLLCLALTLGSCAALAPSEQDMLMSRHAYLVSTSFGIGTGFPVTDEAFLTAWHVVEGRSAEDITVGGFDVIEVIRLGELDAALLVTGPHGVLPWEIRDHDAEPGEPVYKSGYGRGAHWWTRGIATEDPERVGLDICPGDSGGPVYDSRGRVVGLIVAVGLIRTSMGDRSVMPHHAWLVPASALLPLLDPCPCCKAGAL